MLARRHSDLQITSADHQDLGSGAEDVADVVPELRERLQLETTRTATDSAAARFQLYDSVTRFLLRIAARHIPRSSRSAASFRYRLRRPR